MLLSGLPANSEPVSGEFLRCEIQGNADGILLIEVEETELEGQIAVTTRRQPESGGSQTSVSNGTIHDSHVYLYEYDEPEIGTTVHSLELDSETGTWSVVMHTRGPAGSTGRIVSGTGSCRIITRT